MMIRVFDKANDRYYKSMVYGVVNYDNEAIAFNPYTKCFELVPHFDKLGRWFVPVYEVIQPERKAWSQIAAVDLKKLQMLRKEYTVTCLFGYEDVVRNLDFLSAIVNQKQVAVDAAGIQLRSLEDEAEWNYILTQKDADAFMKLFAGFHDSYLNKINYEEDDFGTRKLTAVFDNTCWYGIAELCFEGLVAMNLRPAQENGARYIFGGCLLVKDESVFWADDWMTEENLSYQGSYIKALNLKWRKIGEATGYNEVRDARLAGPSP